MNVEVLTQEDKDELEKQIESAYTQARTLCDEAQKGETYAFQHVWNAIDELRIIVYGICEKAGAETPKWGEPVPFFPEDVRIGSFPGE